MRSELAPQWDIIESDIPDMFQSLSRAVESPFSFLESLIQGEGPRPKKCVVDTDPVQSLDYHKFYHKESSCVWMASDTSSNCPKQNLLES
jgi:hypothetical protein